MTSHNRFDSDAVLSSLDEVGDATDGEIDAAHRIAGKVRALWADSQYVGVDTKVRQLRVTVPAWRSELRAAADAATHGSISHESDLPDLGLEISCTVSDSGEATFAVTATDDRRHDGDIVRIDNLGLLVVLYRDGESLIGRIAAPGTIGYEDISVDVTSAADLSPENSAAITAAVRGSFTSGRNAWRRIARDLANEHPIRAAIVAGLRD